MKVGDVLSRSEYVENGTLQGSVISPIIFNIMINDIFEEVSQDISTALYADDGVLWKRGRNCGFIVQKIQKAIGNVEQWALEWGFKFSISKSCCQFFTRKKIDPNVQIYLYRQPLEKVKLFKYLGLWMDCKLTWKNHIDHIEKKCNQVLNLMRCIIGQEWGADRQALMGVYYALLRSILDYGCIVYESASQTQLKRIDVIQTRGLRCILGAAKTTPIAAMQVELSEMPLHLRRKKLSMAYWINLMGHNKDHLARKILEESWETRQIKGSGFAWKANIWAKEMNLDKRKYGPTITISPIPPWFFCENFCENVEGI